MAEGRILKKKISVDEKFHELESDRHRILFVLALAHTDREGRITGNPFEFLGTVAPCMGLSKTDILEFFKDAEARGLICRYFADEKWIVAFPGFHKNQNINPGRERESIYPPPPGVINKFIGKTINPEWTKRYGEELTDAKQNETEPNKTKRNETNNLDGSNQLDTYKIKQNKIKQNKISKEPQTDKDPIKFQGNYFVLKTSAFNTLRKAAVKYSDYQFKTLLEKIDCYCADNSDKYARDPITGKLKLPSSVVRNWLNRDPEPKGPAVPPEPDNVKHIPDPNCSKCNGRGIEIVFVDGVKKGARPCLCLHPVALEVANV